MKEKSKGQIFTPKNIVWHMLSDVLGWDRLANKNGAVSWPNIRKHIIDNSCGDGAFLSVIVESYIHNVLITTRKSKDEVRELLETYIHGIELDPVEYNKCIERLDHVASLDGITGVKWDIRNCDALSCHDFDGRMDFVAGNPPYVRVHNLECDLTGYSFADGGMTDLYLAFYELGFRMLNETGKLCYITPSSWFLSTAGEKMREYIIENRNLEYVEDYGHEQLFENATTYVAITKFNKKNNDLVKWIKNEPTGDGGHKTTVNTIPIEKICIDGKFYFGTFEQLDRMWEIIEYGKIKKRDEKTFLVKNGFATLADDIFIPGDVPGNMDSKYTIAVMKSSTGKWAHCIYPYDEYGKLITEDELKLKAGFEYNWLLKNRERLENRATTEPWYAFGRTQAIKDTFAEKWAIKSIIKSMEDIKPLRVPIGSGVYGGLYILTEHPEGLEVLETEDFMNYVKMLGKYKSGGYYTFSSKELENYLNYSYGKKKD